MTKFLKIKKIPKNKVLRKKIYIVILIFVSLIGFVNINSIFKEFYCHNLTNSNNKKPKIGGFIWAQLDLTNPAEINNSRFPHYMNINVEGRVYNPYIAISNDGLNVTIVVDGVIDTRYTDITDLNGDFSINYIIDPSLDVYISHIIEAIVTDPEPGGPGSEVQYHHFYIIDVNATSYIEASYLDYPYIPGESFSLDGYLKYDNENGTGILNQQFNYFWYNSSYQWPTNSFFTSSSDGSFSVDITIPYDAYSQEIHLKLSYLGNSPYIGNSEIVVPNITLFSDVIWNWNIVSKVTEGVNITITGEIFSINNNSLKISNRTLIIRYDGTQIDTTETDINGVFTYTFTIPPGIGNRSIQLDLVNTAGRQLNSIKIINITAGAAYNPSDPGGFPPFLLFSLIFFPILAVVVGVLTVLGIRFYKKQEKESRVVNIPLESRLINLKILKDSGRLEESISYLFNAIYMDLINAKYGRARKENETIRDFAIISVKELRLTPAGVYPFIQRVEAIIYAKPFKITENDFYNTCELFSPIYFQLTGYNFTLNF